MAFKLFINVTVNHIRCIYVGEFVLSFLKILNTPLIRGKRKMLDKRKEMRVDCEAGQFIVHRDGVNKASCVTTVVDLPWDALSRTELIDGVR